MKKLAILTLVLMLAMPIVAQEPGEDDIANINGAVIKMVDFKDAKGYLPQEPEARTQWKLDALSQIALQAFHQRYQEDYLELLKVIKAAEMKINPDMPTEALFNEQLQAFVIPKPKEK